MWAATGLVFLTAALGLTAIVYGENMVPGDITVARAIQQPASPQLDTAARILSVIGDDFPGMVVLAIVIISVLMYRGRRDLALFVALAAALRALGPGLKVVINSPRPTLEAVVVVAQANGLGFPSGHAMGAALFYGAIAVIAPEAVPNPVLARSIQILAGALMILIALARVRLGVHWPSDVAGGLLFGLALVCLLRAALLAWRLRHRQS
ncbi:MAG: phosphatase PAP2 family protein [Chloroflexia bacterium]|nr:phosphatase PAP2 family protein [Chloroflexia bacterium]